MINALRGLGMIATDDLTIDQEEALMAKKRPSQANTPDPVQGAGTATTTIHIPVETLQLLRAVAATRMISRGGRMSVSKLVAELIEAQRGALEAEVKATRML